MSDDTSGMDLRSVYPERKTSPTKHHEKGTPEELTGLLELQDVLDSAGPEYETKQEPELLRDEFLTTAIRVQDAERRRRAAQSTKDATVEEKKKKATEYMRDDGTIRNMYRDEIGRALHLDKVCMALGGADTKESTDDTLKQILATLQGDLGYEVLFTLKTIGFLNLPRAGSNHIGKGFVILAQRDGAEAGTKVVTLHFYEHSTVAGMTSKTINSKSRSEAYVIGMYRRDTKEYTHSELDDSHRLTSSVFGLLPSSDIISLSQFSATDARVTSSVRGTAEDSELTGCCAGERKPCCKFVCLDHCPDCDKICSACSTETCLRFKDSVNFEFSTVQGRMIRDLNNFVHEENVERDRAFTFTTRNPFHEEGENAKSRIDLHDGHKEVTSRRTVYKGVEIFFADHVARTQELGVVLCAPDEPLTNILKFTATIMQNVLSTGQPALKNEYYRAYSIIPGAGPADPLSDFGIRRDAGSRLLGGNTWFTNALGIFDFKAEINVGISFPYKMVAVYANLISALAAFLAAAISAATGDSAMFNVMLALYDVVHAIIRYLNLGLERNTNATLRRDLVLCGVGLLIAIIAVATVSYDDDEGRRMLTGDGPPSPQGGSGGEDDDYGYDPKLAHEVSYVLVIIQACLCLVGAIITVVDNKRGSE